MTAPLEDTPVTYEDLNDLNAEFDDVDTELLRQEVQLKNALYEKRQKVVSQIPNFWPLVLEQAPPDIDEFIQPSDSALLLSSLTALSVSHFEVENGGKGDPRSLSIKFEFTENEHFEDRVLEKKFWYRRSNDGWTGLVSEPVEINWKKGKDLTSGLLGMVKKVWEAEQSKAKEGNGASKKSKALTADQIALKKNMETTGLGGLSFFTWFGYIGKYITAEECELANEKAKKLREARQAGKPEEDGEEDDDADEEEDDDELELFPEGESLAIALAEDLWPGAIKYFIQAQEQDGISDIDFESDEEEMEEPDDEEEPPSKKRKA